MVDSQAQDFSTTSTADVQSERRPSDPRRRRLRTTVAIVLLVLSAVAYVAAVSSYRTGFDAVFTQPTPPPGGVALVFTPTKVNADARTASGDLLVFLSPELTDSSGKSKLPLRVEVLPSLTENSLYYAAGKVPSPTSVTLPAPGVVQQYPIDTYGVDFTARASTEGSDGRESPLPTSATVFFQVPGWAFDDATSQQISASEVAVTGTVARDGSTKVVAVMMLVLMVALAVIAVLVVHSTATGRMSLELSVASWITGMLFALLPIRAFLPGDPPVGSWIDILVFFWVEATIMVCVGLAASGLLLRARK